jgi:glycosyltransferase involved in cell wall biosynthesis
MTQNVTPKVTIITTSFNSERTIARTIESILRQSYANIECIIIDGGSSDSTMQIISSYSAQFSGRLRYISERDHGMYDAMNKGILLSTGVLIGILNSDDWYEPDAVAVMVEQYLKSPAAVLYGILRYVERERETMLYRMHHDSLHEGMITHPTCFVPKSIYDRYGTFSLRYRLSSDYELMLRFLKNGVSFIPLDRIVANFSFGGRSTVNYDGLIENIAIRKEYGFISAKRAKWELLKLQTKAYLKKIKINV